MAEVRLPEWMKEPRGGTCPQPAGKARRGIADRNLDAVASFLSGIFSVGEYAAGPGLLQSIEPRARMAGTAALAIACALTGNPVVLAMELLVIAVIAALSGLGLLAVARRAAPATLFTSVLILPAIFNFVTPGTDLLGATIWSARISITREGVETAVFFAARAAEMVALVAVLALTTRQADLFRGLRGLFVPAVFVTALFMAFRYLIVLVKTAQDLSLARRSRLMERESLAGAQGWFSSSAALVLKRSMDLSGEINMAMASRGFKGRLRTLKGAGLSGRDYAWIGLAVFVLILSSGL